MLLLGVLIIVAKPLGVFSFSFSFSLFLFFFVSTFFFFFFTFSLSIYTHTPQTPLLPLELLEKYTINKKNTKNNRYTIEYPLIKKPIKTTIYKHILFFNEIPFGFSRILRFHTNSITATLYHALEIWKNILAK